MSPLVLNFGRFLRYFFVLMRRDAVTSDYSENFPMVSAFLMRNIRILRVLHFISVGEHKNLQPKLGFSPRRYLKHNPDVASCIRPYYHYVTHGERENRLGSALIDESNQTKKHVKNFREVYFGTKNLITINADLVDKMLTIYRSVDMDPKSTQQAQTQSASNLQKRAGEMNFAESDPSWLDSIITGSTFDQSKKAEIKARGFLREMGLISIGSCDDRLKSHMGWLNKQLKSIGCTKVVLINNPNSGIEIPNDYALQFMSALNIDFTIYYSLDVLVKNTCVFKNSILEVPSHRFFEFFGNFRTTRISAHHSYIVSANQLTRQNIKNQITGKSDPYKFYKKVIEYSDKLRKSDEVVFGDSIVDKIHVNPSVDWLSLSCVVWLVLDCAAEGSRRLIIADEKLYFVEDVELDSVPQSQSRERDKDSYNVFYLRSHK